MDDRDLCEQAYEAEAAKDEQDMNDYISGLEKLVRETLEWGKEWEQRCKREAARNAKARDMLRRGIDCGTGELWIEGYEDLDRLQYLEAIDAVLAGNDDE